MSRDRTVTLRIPEDLLASAVRAARAEELTAAEFIRVALADRVAEAGGTGYHDAVGTLRRALRRDFATAGDWLDLQSRLRRQRFVLREVEGELWLHTWPVERRLLPLARLGISREELVLLFRAPFPAHGGKTRVRAVQAASKAA